MLSPWMSVDRSSMPAERLKNTATITEHNIYWDRPLAYSVTDIAERFSVSRGWIWKWVYPALGYERPRPCGTNAGESSARGRRSDKAF